LEKNPFIAYELSPEDECSLRCPKQTVHPANRRRIKDIKVSQNPEKKKAGKSVWIVFWRKMSSTDLDP
jgi:hypothetical protein